MSAGEGSVEPDQRIAMRRQHDAGDMPEAGEEGSGEDEDADDPPIPRQMRPQAEPGQGEEGENKQDSQGNKRGEQQDGRPDSSGQGSQDPQGSREESSNAADSQKQERDAKSPTAQEQAEQRKRAEQARQALQQQMDQALGNDKDQPQNHELGALSKDDPQSKLPAELRQALQRVPDDPGALLRRKFELEYRQRHGRAPTEDEQP